MSFGTGMVKKCRIALVMVFVAALFILCGTATADEVHVSTMAAMQAAISGAGEERTIILDEDITMTATLSIRTASSITVEGNGHKLFQSGTSLSLFTINNAQATLKIQNCQMSGGLYCIHAAAAKELTIKDSSIQSCTRGVNLWNVEKVLISDCDIAGCGIGINFDSDIATVLRLENTKIHNGQGSLVIPQAGASTEVYIEGSEITNNTFPTGYAGIYANEFVGSMVISNTEIKGNDSYIYAGVHFSGTGTLDIRDSTIQENTSSGAAGNGGVIFTGSQEGTLKISNTLIQDNKATTSSGGGVTIMSAKAASVTETTIKGNQAMHGGGFYISNCQEVTISDCEISANTGDYYGGGIYINTGEKVNVIGTGINSNTTGYHGGGMYISACADANVSGVEIRDNTAGWYGGGMYISACEDVNVSESKIGDNTAGYYCGGGMYISASADVNVSGTEINGNTTGWYGGGMYISACADVNVSGAKIRNNTAGWYGGGIYATNTDGTDAATTVEDSDILENAAGSGGGIYLARYASLHLEGCRVNQNTVKSDVATLYGGCGGGIYNAGIFSMDKTEIADNEAGGYGGGIYFAGAKGNIDGQGLTLGSGTIHGNKAGIHGGGIYLPDGDEAAVLTNAVVYNNHAANQGGGVWICPTGDSNFYVTDGTAIFENSAGWAGDDLVIQQPIVKNEGYRSVLSRRMLGGLNNHYYDDGALGDGDLKNPRTPRAVDLEVSRYNPETSVERTDIYEVRDQTEESLVLKNVVSGEAESRAKSRALLEIYDNEAGSCGGGVATNGRLMFGQSTELPITITAKKVWDDGNENHEADSVTINLHQYEPDQAHHDINDYILEKVELNAANNWTCVFENLPEGYHNENKEWVPYIYQITEDPISPYTQEIEETAIEIEVHRDTNNILATNLKYIKVSLSAVIEKADGTVLDITEDMRNLPELKKYLSILHPENGKYVYILDESNNFQADWTGFPWQVPQSIIEKDHLILEHYPIDYVLEIVEAVNDDEDGTLNPNAAITGTMSNTVTVKNIPPKEMDLQVSKVWDAQGSEETAGQLPEQITVRLHANGEEMESAVLNEANEWQAVFAGLMIEDDEEEQIEYTVTEDQIKDFVLTEMSGEGTEHVTLKNTYRPGKTEILVSKHWEDEDDQDGIRPEMVTVELLADGEPTGATAILSAANHWLAEFGNLNVNRDGRAIEYTVREMETAAGYTAEVTGSAAHGFVIVNTHTPETRNLTVTKEWQDQDNQDGKRPAKVSIELNANGETIDTAELNAENGWSWEFRNLPGYEDGEAIIYTITEDHVSDYDITIEGEGTDHVRIVNVYEPGKTSVEVVKTWEDEDDQDGIRPESVTVELIADGESTGKTLTLSEETAWMGIFHHLDIYKDGVEIVYTLDELEEQEGYAHAVLGSMDTHFQIINRHRVEEPEPTPTPTSTPAPTPKPTATPAPEYTRNPNTFYFSFTKEWRGVVSEDAEFTLYNSDGTKHAHKFNIRKVSETEWVYECWLSAADSYYVIETPLNGYITTYVNSLDKAEVKDRVYNGGRIINAPVPKTGDSRNTLPWVMMLAGSMLVLGAMALSYRRRGRNEGIHRE